MTKSKIAGLASHHATESTEGWHSNSRALSTKEALADIMRKSTRNRLIGGYEAARSEIILGRRGQSNSLLGGGTPTHSTSMAPNARCVRADPKNNVEELILGADDQ